MNKTVAKAWILNCVTVAALAALNTCIVKAEGEPAAAPTPVPLKVGRVLTGEAGMNSRNNRIVVEVENLSEAIEKNKINPRDFVLFLDGRALKGIKAEPVEPVKETNRNLLEFQLRRNAEALGMYQVSFSVSSHRLRFDRRLEINMR